jgi:lipopolysaccharide/colanic/teichoic acid biosynthesis glycosyltransferase
MKPGSFLYRPSRLTLLIDLTIVISITVVTLLFFPFTHPDPINKYDVLSSVFVVLWFVISYLLKRYIPLKKIKYFTAVVKLLVTAISTIAFIILIDWYLPAYSYSVPFYIFIVLTTFLFHFLIHFLYFSVRFAVEYTDPGRRVTTPGYDLPKIIDDVSEHQIRKLRTTFWEVKGKDAADWITEQIHPFRGEIRLLDKKDHSRTGTTNESEAGTLILLDPLNMVRGINKMFFFANQQLQENLGILICCFETKSTRKRRILKHYPAFLSGLIYFNDFLIRRFFPKVLMGERMYYNPYRDQYRILPKTEVLGRLSYMGFDVINTRKIEGITYVVALKTQQITSRPPLRFYGPLIKLRRSGKNGAPIIVYKFRTMYAYSEFLQDYMYKTYDLQDGGKFTKDIRVSSWGRLMRKYFIDEIPMIWNIIKGDMKLVGVRPLSNQYLSLYSDDVKQLRSRYKPGLLPPFYADMPGSIEEIQQSEVNYLKLCEKNGLFITDLKYLFKIIYSILFRHAKSS